MLTKSQLAIVLSRLADFGNPDPKREQYMTDSETAAAVLWNAFMQGDVEGRVLADLGCGTGILGIGALLLGARFAHFVDIDKAAIRIAKANLEGVSELVEGGFSFQEGDVSAFNRQVDVAVMNPPFGVQNEHADRFFLLKAFEVARVVYSLHKIESKSFVEQLSAEHGFRQTHLFLYNMPLKQRMAHHTHRIYRVEVGCFRLVRM